MESRGRPLEAMVCNSLSSHKVGALASKFWGLRDKTFVICEFRIPKTIVLEALQTLEVGPKIYLGSSRDSGPIRIRHSYLTKNIFPLNVLTMA